MDSRSTPWKTKPKTAAPKVEPKKPAQTTSSSFTVEELKSANKFVKTIGDATRAVELMGRHVRQMSFSHHQKPTMSEHTYKIIELVGSSHTGIEAAIQNAIAKAAINEKSLRWFEVVETRGHIEDGKVAHWQVTVKIGATLDD